jgi:hypothetical protein
MPKYVIITQLAKQTGRDRANLLKKAKRETIVTNRVIKTPGGWQICATVSIKYANQLTPSYKQTKVS